MRNHTSTLALATLAACVALAIMACVPAGGSLLSDAMAGADGGVIAMLSDAIVPDAAAADPETFLASCDQEHRSTRYAQVAVPGLDPHDVQSVSTVICDCTGSSCPDGSARSEEEGVICVQGEGRTLLGNGFVRVYCGRVPDGASVADATWSHVRVTITR